MRKLAMSAIINTTEATRVQFVQDAVNLTYRFVKTAASDVCLLGPIPYGKTVRVVKIAAQNEFKNTVLIGGATVETILANTRYSVAIWNNEAEYELERQGPMVYSYTSPAVLTSAAIDRTNVYTALANKINAVPSNNVTAYPLAKVPYTLGTSASATNFIVGETVTQATSGITAQVAACVISSGTMAANTAAGDLYLYNFSNVALYDAGTKTWTAAGTVAPVAGISDGSTNIVVTGTAGAAVFAQGLVIVDDPGYFTSNKSRGGISSVSTNATFITATASVIIPGRYAIGVGSDMLARRPAYDPTKKDAIFGDMDLEFSNDELPVSGNYYKKYIFEVVDGDEDAIDARKVGSTRYYVIYINQATGAHITSLDAAIDAAILL